jgi:Protein of unknown function (DUF2800)
MMTKHSSIVGGSTAARLLACPGSVLATLTLPPTVEEVPSPYALEGSFLHAVMEFIMRRRKNGELNGYFNTMRFAEECVGKRFLDRVMTEDHLVIIQSALVCLAQLEREYGDGFRVFAIERHVQFPGVLDAFGTVDLILLSDRYSVVLDWKFGAGVPVNVLTEDGLNPQLAFYLTAAHYTLPKIIERPMTRMVAAIVQPRAETPENQLSHVRVPLRSLATFQANIADAVREALQPNAPRHRGEHCRFAPCQVTCPLFTGPAIDLSAVLKIEPTPPEPDKVTPYGEYLSYAKELVDKAAEFKMTIDAQLHAYLSAGGVVPGWRLKPKGKLRQWIDEGIVEQELSALGYEPHEIWQRKLVTFNAADATAKRKGVKIPDYLRVAPATNETTVCREDDPSPRVQGGPALTELLQESLRRLKNEGSTV